MYSSCFRFTLNTWTDRHQQTVYCDQIILPTSLSTVCHFILNTFQSLNLVLMNLELSFFENTVDPDQLAPDEDIRF